MTRALHAGSSSDTIRFPCFVNIVVTTRFYRDQHLVRRPNLREYTINLPHDRSAAMDTEATALAAPKPGNSCPPLRQSSVTGRRASSEFASCVYCPTPKESYLALDLHRSSICKMALWPIRGFRRATAGLGSPLYEQPCMMNLRPINRARETLVCTHLLSAGLCYVTSHILHTRFARMSSEHVSLLSIGYLTANQGLPRTRILQTDLAPVSRIP